MRVLLTGGAGFIGSNLVDKLISLGHDVRIIDNFDDYYSPEMKMKNIKHHLGKKNFKLIKGDIGDKKLLRSSFKDVEVIFHLAAKVGVRASFSDPFSYNKVNFNGTMNVVDACNNSSVEKLIYSSSSSVYGEPQYLPLDEKHPINPISPYAVSKLAGEKHCLTFSEKTELPTISLRYFTVFGPRQRPDEAICKFTNLILNGKIPEIYGDGEQTRDFTFVDNVVDANIIAMESKTKHGTFNIGSGERLSVNKLIELLNKACGTSIKPKHTSRKRGDVTHTWANIDKAKKTLKYKPEVDIKTGVEKYVQWVKGE